MNHGPYDHPNALRLSRRALVWVRVLNVIYAAGISLMLIISLAAPEFLFGALGAGAARWGIAPLAMRGIMVVGLAGAFIAHRILTRLLEIVDTVRVGDPFVLDNAARLRSIAWWLLGAEALHLLVGVLAKVASTPARPVDIDWTFSFTPYIAVLLLFVLARVFAHGARMREDIAGTV